MARGLTLPVLPREGGEEKKMLLLALFSSVSSILIQSSMGFKESLNDSTFILENQCRA